MGYEKAKRLLYFIINLLFIGAIIDIIFGDNHLPSWFIILFFIVLNGWQIYRSRHFIKSFKQYVNLVVEEKLKERKDK